MTARAHWSYRAARRNEARRRRRPWRHLDRAILNHAVFVPALPRDESATATANIGAQRDER